MIICIILVCDDVSYERYAKYYETIGERLHEEYIKHTDFEIISCLDAKKNKKIAFISNCDIIGYQIFGKTNRNNYSAECIYSIIANLHQKDKPVFILIEGYSNPQLSVSYPQLFLDSFYYMNNKKKAKVYLFKYTPNADMPPHNEVDIHPVYSESFENRSLEQTYKVWHAIKSGRQSNITLEINNPIQGKISLSVDSSECQDSTCYFSNFNKFKKDDSDYLLSFSTRSTPQSTLGVYVGLWIRPPDNLISFQIYSDIQLDSSLKRHYVIIPRLTADKENYFSFFFSVSNGEVTIDDISLKRIPLSSTTH